MLTNFSKNLNLIFIFETFEGIIHLVRTQNSLIKLINVERTSSYQGLRNVIFLENVASALTGWFPIHVFINKCIQETVEKRSHFTFSFDSKETFDLEFLISFFSKIYALLCEVCF